jgi:hypothetical protein
MFKVLDVGGKTVQKLIFIKLQLNIIDGTESSEMTVQIMTVIRCFS